MVVNIKYELQELEKIMSDAAAATPSSDVAGIIQREVERIKQTFIYEVFHFEDERHLERYIQYHQQSLIRLMDKNAVLAKKQSKEQNIWTLLYKAFDELLAFVERHFTKYFDQDAKAPEGYLALARKDARAGINRFQKDLESKNGDHVLIALVLKVLRRISECNAEKGTTYRKVMYAKEVQKELEQLVRREDNSNINDELLQVIYYLNYNSIKVVTYHAHYISSLLDRKETRTEKIEALSLMLKNINQAQVKPGIAYELTSPSLKSQLVEYITVELEYHERLQQLSGRGSGPSSDDSLSGFKLKFEASVSQLAYLLKVLIETRVIVNNNLTQVINFIVRFVMTKKSEHISYGSLRSKFYNTEIGTKASVRNMLLSLIHYIDRN